MSPRQKTDRAEADPKAEAPGGAPDPHGRSYDRKQGETTEDAGPRGREDGRPERRSPGPRQN